MELLSEIKQKLCIIQKEKKENTIESKTYCLPDDTVVRLHEERHKVPEAIFNPSLINIDKQGLPNCCFKSVMKCMTDIRSEMYNNIVLAGGNTMFENFKGRMELELRQLFPIKTNLLVIDKNERMYSSWIGGSIIGNMDTFQHLSISRKEFEEQGVRIVHNKTF